jgi:hypothetical protein
MSNIQAVLPPSGRDLRLDLFRGIANWAIFLDHIPHNIVAWVTTRNYGFSDAADLFVFISGYTASFVYAKVMLERGFMIGAIKLLKRVWQLYVAHILLFIIYIAAIGYLAQRYNEPEIIHEFNVAGLIDNPIQTIFEGLILKFKPVNLDVLPLYIVLMAVFPFVLWLMLRQPDTAMLASLVLYVAARLYHWDLTSYPTGVWYFDPFTWQLLFMLGAWLALGGAIRLTPIAHARWSLSLSIAFLVFAFAMTMSEPIPALRALFPDELRAAFVPNDKTYLAPYRVAHLAALIVLVVHFIPKDWHGLEWAGFAPLIKCGQHSLEVFCVGVYLAFVAHFILIIFSDSLPMQLAVGAGGLSIMVAVAWYRAWSKDIDRPIPRLVPAPAAVKAAIPPPPWRPLSERRRHRHELADRLKQQRGGDLAARPRE